MILSCIVALSDNAVIGRDGKLPWHLPADLQRFRRITMGHPILMGRKTWESIGRPLPGRTNVVLTRSDDFEAPGTRIFHSLDDALEDLAGEEEVFVIGGEGVFRESLPRAERLYITRVHEVIEGDVVFPEEILAGWILREEERRPADEKNAHDLTFQLWERAPAT